MISIHALHEESDWSKFYRQTSPIDISIHALHEESDARANQRDTAVKDISIHALHEESDHSMYGTFCFHSISIHALHEESDLDAMRISSRKMLFQSTLSMRRATSYPSANRIVSAISIHALHEESDSERG